MRIFGTTILDRKHWLAVSLIVAVTLVAATIGGASVLGSNRDEALITGGTGDQQALAARISSGIDIADISRVEIGKAPEPYGPNPDLGEYGTTWLTVFVDAPGVENGGTVIPQWAAQLLVGEFRDLSHRQGMPDVLGSSIVYQLPDGSQTFGGGSVIATPFDQSFAPTSEAETQATIRARANALRGLKDVSVSFQHPDTSSATPVVTETASDVQALLDASPSVAQATLGDFRRVPGGLLVIKDSQGKTVRIGAFSTRTGLGTLWTDPAYADLGGGSVSGG